MVLFDNRNRTRQEPLHRGERLFDFYDSCGRPGYDQWRAVVDTWLSEMPAEVRNGLVPRMQGGNNREFRTALLEIVLHAALVRLGCDVIVHPGVPNSERRPDFRAEYPESNEAVFVEATTINQSREQEAERNREDPVYNAIDRIQLPPGCMLTYRLVQVGLTSPSLRELIRSIEEWARENVNAAQSGSIEQVFTLADWEIELGLFAGGSATEPPTRAIGVVSSGASWIAPHQDLKSTLEGKGSRYGALDAPFLIAVADAREEFLLSNRVIESTLDALLGSEAIEVTDGDATAPVRLNNGFWFGSGNPRNRQVSGVLVMPSAQLWHLRRHPPILAINPWAQYPLPTDISAMRSVARDGDRWTLRYEATALADILQLPDPWPPEG